MVGFYVDPLFASLPSNARRGIAAIGRKMMRERGSYVPQPPLMDVLERITEMSDADLRAERDIGRLAFQATREVVDDLMGRHLAGRLQRYVG